MITRCKLIVALGAGALAAPFDSFAQRQDKMIDGYKQRIHEKIVRFVVRPPNLKGNEESEFDIEVLPDGNVGSIALKRSSGNSAYDNAVERAIRRAQPLPMPPDPALAKDFPHLTLKLRAQE